jgi:hypothetical protein
LLSFSLKKSWQANPLQVPQRGPYGERYPLTEHFYVSLDICLFIFPSGSLVRGPPPPPSLFPSGPDRQGYSATVATGLFIRSFTYVCRSPQKRSPPTNGEKHNVTIPQPHADGRATCSRLQPGSPRGSLMTLLSLPCCRASFGTIPSTLAWVDWSPVSQRVF